MNTTMARSNIGYKGADAKPKRIQRKRTKGWCMPAGSFYVGRPTIWGNPYLACATQSAEQAVRAFRMGVQGRWTALQKLEGHSDWSMLTVMAHFQQIRRRLHELRGKNLACWCGLDDCCHADVLLELANAKESPK